MEWSRLKHDADSHTDINPVSSVQSIRTLRGPHERCLTEGQGDVRHGQSDVFPCHWWWLRSKVFHHVDLCTFKLTLPTPLPLKPLKNIVPYIALYASTPLLLTAYPPPPNTFPVFVVHPGPLQSLRLISALPSSCMDAICVLSGSHPPITPANQTNGLYPLFNGTVTSEHRLQAITEGHKATPGPCGL